MEIYQQTYMYTCRNIYAYIDIILFFKKRWCYEAMANKKEREKLATKIAAKNAPAEGEEKKE
jgi:hypothetical protein